MTKLYLAAATAFALLGGVAMAETTATESSTTTVLAPPVGTLSTTHTEHRLDSDGTRTDSRRTTYRNEAGVAEDVQTTKTMTPPPPPPPVSTSSGMTITTTTR